MFVCVELTHSVSDSLLQSTAGDWIPLWSVGLLWHARATEAPPGRLTTSQVHEGDKRWLYYTLNCI